MAHSYKNKVQYDADLLKGAGREAWEQEMLRTLNEAWNTYTGRNVLDELGLNPHVVKIVPYYGKDVNANAEARNYAGAYYPGRPVRWADHGELAGGGRVGTGSGSAVRLNFTPWRFSGEFRAVILIHEMTHAAEQQRGKLFCMTVHSACFDTVAEFDAIVVENIMRSELNLPIRKDHHSFRTLSGTRMLPQEGELRARVDSFERRMPHLTRALANVRVPFNPLRAGNPGAP